MTYNTHQLLSLFLSWTLGFQLFRLQNLFQELDSPIAGKAAFFHLRPWADFVKNRNYIGCLSCGKMSFALFFFFLIFKIGYFYMMGALSVNAAGSQFQRYCFCR